jgi:hypothetical protein
MTARKGNKLSRDDVERFEALAIATIEGDPTTKWEASVKLWRWLPLVWPSTRDRIIRRALVIAAERNDSWSATLVKRFAEAAIPAFDDTRARGRVHNAEALQKAARYKARHPKASLNDIAKDARVKRDTVRDWLGRGGRPGRRDFCRYYCDEWYQINLERRRRLRHAVERLHHQRKRIYLEK